VADLPWHGVSVRLELRTRRFRCQNSLCTKRVFCERLPRVVAYYGRKTVRLDDALRLIGLLLGSLAEVMASYMYDLELLPGSHRYHDARCRTTGVNVRIKGTQRDRVAMYAEPDHLIVLRLAVGRAEEVYNGPGAAPWVAAGPVAKNGREKHLPFQTPGAGA